MDRSALAKLERYCAYQERCQQEVRGKLLRLKVYGDELEQIMSELIASGFLNESRFAQSYARGKFRNNGWGREKIALELRRRQISPFDIRHGLEEIEEDEYREKLAGLLLKKRNTLRAKSSWEMRQKLFRFAQQKGYETELISRIICEILENQSS